MENNDNQGSYLQSEPQWICPDCETVNSGDNCTVCGCPRPQKKRDYGAQETAAEQGSYHVISGNTPLGRTGNFFQAT